MIITIIIINHSMIGTEMKTQKSTEENMKCMFAQMFILNSRFHRLFNRRQEKEVLDNNIASVSHKRKKVNEKLTAMNFLKDNKTIILGYDKTSERGDINFIDVCEPKISDFYYNKLNGGLGGLSCFEDGRFVIVADKKGVIAYVDLSKGPNIEDIKNNSIETAHQGIQDLCLSPRQTKIVCGMNDNRCIILDIGREKVKSVPKIDKMFNYHNFAVNCVNWHPFKSLILSSSLDVKQRVVLWDPHSEKKAQSVNFHNNATITRTQFHPSGNSFFSIGKDNSVFEYQIRYSGFLNKFKLDSEPTAVEIMQHDHIVIGQSSGNLNWFDKCGMFIQKIQGNSGVVRLSVDSTKTLLAVARQRQHTFDFYTHGEPYNLDLI